METYKLNFLYLLRLKFCVIAYAIVNLSFIIYNTFRLFTVSATATAISQEKCLLRFVAILFIMFLFVSYYYFSRAKSVELAECTCVTHKGKNGFYLSQFSVMLTFVFMSFVIAFAIMMILSIKHNNLDAAYLLYCFKFSFLYFFLFDVMAILLGLACTNIKKSSLAYIVLVVFSFLFSPLANELSALMYNVNRKNSLYFIWELFKIYPRDFFIDNSAYGSPVNVRAFSTVVVWISLLALILALTFCLFRTRKSKIAYAVVFALVLSLSFVSAVAPYSEAPLDENTKDGFMADCEYYVYKDLDKFTIQKDEKPDYNITSYDMKLDINRLLKAEICVKLDKSNLDEYRFTLYHGYKIKSILDSNGEKLKFDRDGDYVIVYPNSNTATLTFIYKGSSPLFYSNSQGTYLPAGFSYYPINGFHYVYNLADAGRIPIKLNEPVPMRVKVDCKKEMYSNLDRTEFNTFEGVSDGLTLVSGYYNELTVDDTRLVYMEYENWEIRNTDYETLIRSYIQECPQYKGKTIIVAPHHSLSSYESERKFESNDHIIAESVYAAFFQTSSNKDYKPRLDLVFAFMNYYDENSELYRLCQMDANELPNIDDLNVVLAKKIKEYGSPEEMYKMIRQVNVQEWENDDIMSLISHLGEEYQFQHPTVG